MTTITDLSRYPVAGTYGVAAADSASDVQHQARFAACMKSPALPLALADVRNLAALSLNAYSDRDAPAGWRRLNNDVAGLAELGLAPAIFEEILPGGHAALFRDDTSGRHVLAFRGSDSVQDFFYDNIPQSRGRPTAQYLTAIELARTIATAIPAELTVTGHSLGGGLAAAASIATGAPAVTFNAAGLHPSTVERAGYALGAADAERITNYYFQHELLSAVQNNPLLDAIAALTATPLEYGDNIYRLLRDQTRQRDWRPAYLPAAIGYQIALPPVDRQGKPMVQTCQQRYDSFGLHSLQRVIDALDYCLDDANRDLTPSPTLCLDSHMSY